jgi:tetratricopeptide (TPR) repeat protein
MSRMENPNLDETHPVPTGDELLDTSGVEETQLQPIAGDTVAIPVSDTIGYDDVPPEQPGSVEADRPSRRSPIWWVMVLISLLALAGIALLSAYSGYQSGINERTSYEITLTAQEAQQQFEQGLQDIAEGRYEVARQRFEYVIQLNPNYPGVTEKLAEVLLEIRTTATPTTAPTPTLTPTVDLRGAEELYAQAQAMLINNDWSGAIDTLLKLRKDEPDYRAIDVDSMLYVALRNRGVEKILNQADLEGGTYDLALAEKFGPLDVEADNYRLWADLYVTGVSFWELDWGQASYYFGQITLVAPNLRDSSNITATERYRIATINYADTLAENDEWCQAQEQYQAVLNMFSDPDVEAKYNKAAKQCEDEQAQEDNDE